MKNYLTLSDKANEIKMSRSQYKGSFLIVEGDTDSRLFKHLTDRDQRECKVKVAGNKKDAKELLEILEKESFKGVLAIVDADFDRLQEQFIPNSSSLFLTDCHDIEAMMVKSRAFEKLLDEHGSEEKIAGFIKKNGSLREVLLNSGEKIGYLRWLSQKDELSLKFEGLKFGGFVDKETLQIDLKKLVQEVKNKSEKHSLNQEEIIKKITDLSSSNFDLWDVCCGHDLIEILSQGLGKAIGSERQHQDITAEKLEKSLRLAYEITEFKKTSLYKSIKDWESRNSPYRVLVENS